MVAAAWSAGGDDDLSGCARGNAADVVGEQDAEEPDGAAVRFVLTTEALGPGSAARRLLSRIRASEARVLVVKVAAAACEARRQCWWRAARARVESTVAALVYSLVRRLEGKFPPTVHIKRGYSDLIARR